VPPFLAKIRVSKGPILPKGGTQQVNRHKAVGKVGKFNLCFRPERLTSPAGVLLLHDFAQRLGMAQRLDVALAVKARQRGYSEG
jgi:hypothetical protein